MSKKPKHTSDPIEALSRRLYDNVLGEDDRATIWNDESILNDTDEAVAQFDRLVNQAKGVKQQRAQVVVSDRMEVTELMVAAGGGGRARESYRLVHSHVRSRRADARDAEVGRKVHSRRLECRLSQTELADRIGVTFQQVQKYEKGVNRVGAGRLQRISEALEVPISFFFGGGSSTSSGDQGASESVFGFMQTSGSVRIVKAFHKIKSRKARKLLVEMAEEFADLDEA